ncbi:MAG TPA: proline iminopeptidase-family hydrolase [Phnomibacter sp.]|nr:proline iminopeptidase-family hydrolase [Phnomibacter sp.]
MKLLLPVMLALLMAACQQPMPSANNTTYLTQPDSMQRYQGGVKMIPITTPKGTFKVWTKRVGNNPRIKILLLHGGPGATHEYWECADSYLPAEGIEYYYYDQLGSHYSSQPNDTSLWHTARFVEEVEQVRQALGLDSSNFFIVGHSWGGILGLEYAHKYQQHLKGLIVSNMMASIPQYMHYADSVLGPQMPKAVYDEIMALEKKEDYSNPRYMELISQHYYTQHVLRRPLEEWPEPAKRGFNHTNPAIYVLMQGPSEFGVKGNARLKNWDFTPYLKDLYIPVLTIGGQYDTMDPEHMKWMATQVQKGKYLHCPNSGHMAMYDDQALYWKGVADFVKGVDAGK